ncbi:N-acetylmuramoyl-L-alanine amidase [Caldisericum exile]|uniref:N-acetylmuramoyl-L-alanine amidase n=1 Tax=Caldisericum exile (strain DSM 21853 / NBRC 104410 / AZM16c01) TaxID=511051 RepID=A0A7U6GFB4_CALEA|nr:N-acetylmuramoyl-L-alanine amidase [Caldisericum exile]BAL81343.1 putative N-acetylmuramoyl-L-alanine amidase [Caldisericum exile AZM16c01]
MKKIIIISMLIIYSLVVVFVAQAVYSETRQEFLSINADGTNVRSAPGTYNPVLFKLNKGTYVLNLGTGKDKNGGLWYKIYDFNSGKIGFVANYLCNKTGILVTGEDKTFTAKVNTDYLNVRAGPGTEFNLVKRLNYGTKISVTRLITRSDSQIWYKYKDGNNFYFVASWFTVKVEETKPNNQDNNSSNNNSNQNNSGTQNNTQPKDNLTIPATSTDFVNLREGPSTDYGKITLINKGDQITIIGFAKNHNGELWLQCRYNDKIGFVISDYFKFDANKIALDISTIGSDAKTNDSTNLREGPSTSYNVLKVVPTNTTFNIVGVCLNKDKEMWFEVNLDGTNYWVRSDTITFAKKEKGILESALWKITEDGIDIQIGGKNLPKPNINTLSDPIRLVLTYNNTNLLDTPKQADLNIYPFTRYTLHADNNNTVVTIYLLSEIPYQFEVKDNQHLIHFKLPKVNQEIVEIGGSVTFINIEKTNNITYISLDDFLNFFNLNMDNYALNFFGKTIKINNEDIINSKGENFISLENLAKYFNVSIIQTSNEIYIDPLLLDFKKDGSSTILTFSFPFKAKKINENNKDFLVIFAENPLNIPYKSTKRETTTAPQIIIELGNISYSAKDNTLTLAQIKTGNSNLLSNRIIVIDPGHGSYSGQYLDVGAIGFSGTKEAYIVLDIALRLKKLLEDAGAKVIITHNTVDNPNNPTLKGRVDIANSSGGDLFISIHLNSSINSDASGTETYYWYDSSKRLADTIQSSLVKTLGTYDRGIKKDYLYVLRGVTTMPAILTEIGFISNPKEEALLKDSNFLDKVAKALFDGIVRYLNG